jgi:hypothetical protein
VAPAHPSSCQEHRPHRVSSRHSKYPAAAASGSARLLSSDSCGGSSRDPRIRIIRIQLLQRLLLHKNRSYGYRIISFYIIYIFPHTPPQYKKMCSPRHCPLDESRTLRTVREPRCGERFEAIDLCSFAGQSLLLNEPTPCAIGCVRIYIVYVYMCEPTPTLLVFPLISLGPIVRTLLPRSPAP